MKTINVNRNVYRINRPVCGGWQVRTSVGGRCRSRFFSDKNSSNDPVKALIAASTYRDIAIDFINR